MKRHLAAAVLAALLCGVGAPSGAQQYPTRAVRMIVPTTPGSGPDLLARQLGLKLSERWGQPVVVENKPGATGVVATDQVAKAPPDGYMLVLVPNAYSSNPSLYNPFPFDPLHDLVPVAQVALGDMVLVVPPTSPAKTFAEFVALAKSEPGKLNYGSAGNGSTHHMTMELLKYVAGLDVVHVPYRGPGPIMPDLLNGRLSVAFVTANVVPTVGESGYKSFDPHLWYGILAPGNTPAEIVRKIYTDVTAILETAEIKDALRKQGLEAAPMAPAPFAAMIRDDIAVYAKLIKDAGIKAD
jgi:tripartite-type tricarboxylate transporter receptor subunit TctC